MVIAISSCAIVVGRIVVGGVLKLTNNSGQLVKLRLNAGKVSKNGIKDGRVVVGRVVVGRVLGTVYSGKGKISRWGNSQQLSLLC